MAAVDLIDVTRKVGKNIILQSINMSIKKGEFMVIVGPSGCGKSTLLRLIAGLDELTSGSILINNNCVNNVAPAKRDMAMVFQNYALYPHMTVYNNMAYGLKMRGFKTNAIQERVMQAAKMLHLTPFLERKPVELSGGQKQRVAMGRAMVRQPAVFLFDEPLSNLDANLRMEMRHELRRLHQQLHTTSLYVTHDQTEAMTMAERVLVLNHGFIEQVGTPRELYQQPASLFVAGFTGHYPLNTFKGIYSQKDASIQTESGVCYACEKNYGWADKTPVTVAIRAEHVQLIDSTHPQAVPVQVEFIDDMGADKLIRGTCETSGEPISLRVRADAHFSGERIHALFPNEHMHLFQQNTGQRIGEDYEKNNAINIS
ncbi:MAG: sn-glycerol-3-phosphate ABC transporter ATP-binding protein UgpC [Legionella sp.]|nr:sn-glycerol-3-phosphate ABC transporter ATP-binding protein UgpC [Legionella sp.]